METSALQKREVFHLAFLRAMARGVPMANYALKGGCNLRLFFGSVRYSEDMDLDTWDLPVHTLRDKVMSVLESSGLADTLRIYGVARVQPPDIARAKQTETVQRFKVQLVTTAGEELSTKIEFSRRDRDQGIKAEAVSGSILASYRLPPLIVPHYQAEAAIRQKIDALASRREPQARDIFDLFILSSRPEALAFSTGRGPSRRRLLEARERVFAMEFGQYRDTVVDFLEMEDRQTYGSRDLWDEIRLQTIALLDRLAQIHE